MNIWGLFDSGNNCYKKAVYEYNSQWGGATLYYKHRYR